MPMPAPTSGQRRGREKRSTEITASAPAIVRGEKRLSPCVRPLTWSPTASSPPNYAEGPAHHISWDRSVGRRSSTEDRANAFRAKVGAGGRNALQGDLCIKAPSCSSSHFLRGSPPP